MRIQVVLFSKGNDQLAQLTQSRGPSSCSIRTQKQTALRTPVSKRFLTGCNNGQSRNGKAANLGTIYGAGKSKKRTKKAKKNAAVRFP
jgi:hypothetical protein